MIPCFVTNEGEIVTTEKTTTPSEVDETPMELWKVAAREAARQSTKSQGSKD
jgi:hypothetical protein